MDKKDLIKIAAVLGVLIFLGSMLYTGFMSGAFDFQNKQQKDVVVSGTALVNGTLRTYDPILFIASATSSEIEYIKNDSRVKAVEPTAQGWIINVTLRDDVYPLAKDLKNRNITTTAAANIAVPSQITLKLANGTEIDTYFSGAVIRIAMEPVVDADSDIEIAIVGTALGNRLTGYVSAQINQKKVNLEVNGTVSKLEYITQIFTIPWESRGLVNENTPKTNGTVSYTKENGISFANELTVNDTIRLKNLSYITYISQFGAGIDENFTNKNTILADFGNATIVFPDSKLYVQSPEDVALNYTKTNQYAYEIGLPKNANGYDLTVQKNQVVTTKKLIENTTVAVKITGTAIGNRLLGTYLVTLKD